MMILLEIHWVFPSVWSRKKIVRRSFLLSETVKYLSIVVTFLVLCKYDTTIFNKGERRFCPKVRNPNNLLFNFISLPNSPVDIGPTKICALDKNNKIDACQVGERASKCFTKIHPEKSFLWQNLSRVTVGVPWLSWKKTPTRARDVSIQYNIILYQRIQS